MEYTLLPMTYSVFSGRVSVLNARTYYDEYPNLAKFGLVW